MKILKIDKRLNQMTVIPETGEDLWHLEKVLEKGDIVTGKTDRKIKPAYEGAKAERVTLFIELEVIDAHFQEFSANLRINGIIISGKPEEYIEQKSHQSIDIELGEKIRIQKKEIQSWQIERVKKAEQESTTAKLLVVLLDDEYAELALVNQFSIQKKAKIKSDKRGKRYAEEKSAYFDEILAKIVQLAPQKILIAGPGFTKDNFKKFFDDKKPKGFTPAYLETTSEVGETGFKELVSQGKLGALEKELQLSKEGKLIDDYLAKLAKGKAEYGKDKVMEMIALGAAETVLIAETTLMQDRHGIEALMNSAEKSGCDLYVISSKNPQEKQIHGFGGVVCTLRYKVQE